MESQAEPIQDKPASIIDSVRDPKNIATAGVICYTLGFLIESVFYTSLGIASLEFARTKYIVTGALFLLYFLAFFYPFYATWRFVVDKAKRFSDLLLYYPLFAIPIALVWTAVVSGLSSVGSVRPFDRPVGVGPTLDWSEIAWDGGKRLFSAVALTALVLLGLLGFFLLADLVRRIRRIPLSKTRWAERAGGVRGIATTTFTTYFFLGLFGFFSGISSKTVNSFLPGARVSVLTFSVDDEWRVYWLSPLLVGFAAYALLASIIWFTLSNSETNPPNSVIEPGSRIAAVSNYVGGWIRTLFVGSVAKALVPVLVVPYATLVFPTLPPQLGGGRPVLANISFKQPIAALDGGQSLEADVLVRGPNIIFLTREVQPTVVEVPAASIDSIRYVGKQRFAEPTTDGGNGTATAVDGGVFSESTATSSSHVQTDDSGTRPGSESVDQRVR
ncbi:MAG: hypothetical protein GQE15_31365 [Archangiaceae bacterium]|nr:hypothetical protein [Archangiaceae bacterium]